MIAVTNRKLCTEPLEERVGRLASAGAEMVILREKDLDDARLTDIAVRCLDACSRFNTPMAVNGNTRVARELGIDRIHLQMDLMRTEDLGSFDTVGASIHCVAEAVEAEGLGADYLIAGHVFPTACKVGEPRGLGFLEDVCDSVDIPVYAIGGISPSNFEKVLSTGAAGACIMSSAMKSDNPELLVSALTRNRNAGSYKF